MFAHWPASWPVLVGYFVLAGWHLAGLRPLTAGQPGPAKPAELRREAAMFQLGLLLILLALISPLGYWSAVYIWVRAMQALVLTLVAPGLIVLGAPWLAFRALLRPRPGQATAAATTRVPRMLSYPVASVVAVNVVFLAWQVPALFDQAETNGVVAAVMYASYVAAGLLLWLTLISSRPLVAAASPLRRMALLAATVGAWTLLGMVLVFGNGVLYPVYANSYHHAMTVLDDQQLSGAVLWMGMLPAMIAAGIVLMMQWLNEEESADLSAGLNRLLGQRRGGWPSRSVIR